MPSIHVGWAAVVSLGIVAVSTSRWRWVFLLHLILTTSWSSSATANHWWLDGVVAVVLLLAGLAADTAVRRYLASRKAPDAVPSPAPPDPVSRPRARRSSTAPAAPSCRACRAR